MRLILSVLSHSLRRSRDRYNSWIHRPRDPLSPLNRNLTSPPVLEVETSDNPLFLMFGSACMADVVSTGPRRILVVVKFTRVDTLTRKR